MFDNLKYAYLIGSLFFFVIWLILFISRKDLRKQMLTMSLIIALFGPIAQFFHLRDYWLSKPFTDGLIGLEDVLFAFSISGISAIIYEVIFGKRFAKRHSKSHPYWMMGFIAFSILFMIPGNLILGFNSLYVSAVGLLIIGLFIIIFRHDLIKDALFSGLFVGSLLFIFYYIFYIPLFPNIIQEWWLLENISGILIGGVPIEEPLWGFTLGFAAGPLYEFIIGIKTKKR